MNFLCTNNLNTCKINCILFRLRYKKEVPEINTFAHCITSDKITSMITERINIRLTTWRICNNQMEEESGKSYIYIYHTFTSFISN